jgi:pimeloyl-ACP methyl ester carboxylesterase
LKTSFAAVVLTSTLIGAIDAHAECRFEAFQRTERLLVGRDKKTRIMVMSIRSIVPRKGAVVFLHGSGSGGSASFDLQFGDYSLMRALACEGFDAFAFDARGFGGSSLPSELTGPADASGPIVRAAEVMDDVETTVAWALKTSSVAEVDLVGWSWGSDVAGMYAGLHPERVRRMVLMSPVYDRRWP